MACLKPRHGKRAAHGAVPTLLQLAVEVRPPAREAVQWLWGHPLHAGPVQRAWRAPASGGADRAPEGPRRQPRDGAEQDS